MNANRHVVLRRSALFLFPIALMGIGFVISYVDGFDDFRRYVKGKTVPEILVKSGRTGKTLRLLEDRPLANVRLERFEGVLAPSDMPSSRMLYATARQTMLPTLSVAIDAEDLLNLNSGILANYSKRGRAWERPAYVSYFENGELQFAVGAGMRVHGGLSRHMSNKSFRLHFREVYGSPSIPQGYLFEGKGDPIRSIVIHNDLRTKYGRPKQSKERNVEWHFMNPLAYELARKIGCITPHTQPVQFYLNGVYRGPYVLTEHISEDFLTARFGRADFVFVRTKGNESGSAPLVKRGNPKRYDDLREWSRKTPGPLTMGKVEERVDLLNLTNWIISVLYSGVTDPFQGAAVLDESNPNARWFWVNWDMDHAFMDLHHQVDNPWEIDNFTGRDGVLKGRDPRSVLFDRLRKESPDYRLLFLARFTEILNHVLTPQYLARRIDYYEDIAISYGISDRNFIDAIRKYVEMRPAVLRRQLGKYFGAGESYQLTVKSRHPMKIKVDGYDVGNEYVGWYFKDTAVRIELPMSNERSRYAWIVNGQTISSGGHILERSLTTDTQVLVR